jgi:hypothetical protein
LQDPDLELDLNFSKLIKKISDLIITGMTLKIHYSRIFFEKYGMIQNVMKIPLKGQSHEKVSEIRA